MAIDTDEPPEYARHFILCEKSSMNPPLIAAQIFASKGGAAWQHKNGVWICAQDAKKKPIYDYKPNNFRMLYHPSTLVRGANGRFPITATRGSK